MKWVLIIILLIPTFGWAVGSPDYNPDGAHPRIWIDSTIKTDMQAKVSGNTAEWQTLKAWCDLYDGSSFGGGYQGSEWHKAVMNFGACYQATGQASYGVTGVTYLTALLNDKLVVGDGLGGAASITVDSGWTARTFGAGLAVGRDWLEGATGLDATLKAQITARLGEWITWFGASGYSRATPEDNYYAGYFIMVYTAAIGTYGDSGYDAAWMPQAKSMWANTVIPLLEGLLSGGDWVEGWNYGQWASREILQFPHAMNTGAGDGTRWGETTWHTELANSYLHFNYPDMETMTDDGSWSGSYKGNIPTGTMSYLAEIAGLSADSQAMLRWTIANITWEPIPAIEKWENFMWGDSLATQIEPTLALVGSSYKHIQGTDKILTRSAWENVDATFIDFTGANRTGAADIAEAEKNAGDIKVGSRSELLLIDGDTYETDGTFANIISVTGSHTYAPSQEWWRHDASVISEDTGTHTYIEARNFADVYDGNLNDTPSLEHYDRSILFVRPDYLFVYDNAIATAAGTNTVKQRWFWNGNPTVSGDVTTLTVNNAKLNMTVVAPAVTIGKTLNTGSRAGTVYYTDVDVDADPKINQILTVIETAGSVDTSATATPISATGGIGALIGSTAAIFTTSPTGTDIAVASYTTDATAHYIADVPPLAEVVVTKNGSAIPESPITSSAAGLITFTTTAGSADYVITAGTPPDPTCFDTIQNGDETGPDCGGSCAACEVVVQPLGGIGARWGIGQSRVGSGTMVVTQ